MTPAKAMELLGLAAGYSPDDVQQAFRTAARTAHPDTSGASAHPADITLIMQAKKVLLDTPGSAFLACVPCKGRGYVKSKMAARKCGSCGGSGERRYGG